jgi:2-hydroxy-3-keto-5-methylthiopentenyl-1-phosphate phosphatase
MGDYSPFGNLGRIPKMSLKLYRQLLIRTEFIIQKNKNLDEQYVQFLKEIKLDPMFKEFHVEINEDIREFGVTSQEIQSSMKAMIPVI